MVIVRGGVDFIVAQPRVDKRSDSVAGVASAASVAGWLGTRPLVQILVLGR
jgi:hypothetical protein